MHKIGVFSDVHGNEVALDALLAFFKREGIDDVIHLGDAICIGPRSRQCLEKMLDGNVTMLLGNHDRDFVLNLPEHRTLSHVSTEHKEYVFASLKGYEEKVKAFPLYVTRKVGDSELVFSHYAFDKVDAFATYPFKLIDQSHDVKTYDDYYESINCLGAFFGHKHEPCDLHGKKQYVDVGSIGCYEEPFARGIVITVDGDSWHYERVKVPYDREKLKRQMCDGSLPNGQYLFDFYFDKKLSD